jgi:hypothetical protein
VNTLKLNPAALGLTIGTMLGLTVLFLSALANTFLAGVPISLAVGSLYLTYNTTLLSCLIFGVSTFICAGGSGYLLALIYNFLSDLV